MKQVGIIGGAGYTAGELIRILLQHKKVNLKFVYSNSNAGNQIAVVHKDLLGETAMKFSAAIDSGIDILFLCLAHGKSKEFLNENEFSKNTRIIDLSQDFRLNKNSSYGPGQFVYGLPELNREVITGAQYIANPGCFATALQLALLPLAKNQLIHDDVHINAVTGATGAGVSLKPTSHFSYRDNNFSYYKPFVHQHLDEINESLLYLQDSFSNRLEFIPNRGNFSRGIFASLYTKFDGTLEEAIRLYKVFYKEAAFTFISETSLHLKQVLNTNKCFLHLHKHEDKILITSVLDNLLKGASGQAVQNMNLLMGFDEKEGLGLKGSYF